MYVRVLISTRGCNPAILTVIWNLSKRADNASGLVQPELFDLLFSLLSREDEEGDVLRRIASCVQNLASMRRYSCCCWLGC